MCCVCISAEELAVFLGQPVATRDTLASVANIPFGVLSPGAKMKLNPTAGFAAFGDEKGRHGEQAQDAHVAAASAVRFDQIERSIQTRKTHMNGATRVTKKART